MTRAKKTTCCACVVLALLAALAAVTGAWGLSNQVPSDRDLTDEEMAGLFGRQPEPKGGGPDCLYCEVFETVTDCSGTNQCGLCVAVDFAETINCVPDYWIFAGNDASDSAVFFSDPPWNIYIVHRDTVFCKSRWQCISGTAQNNKVCNQQNGCVDGVGSKCRTCTKGDAMSFHTKPDDWCEDCPP